MKKFVCIFLIFLTFSINCFCDTGTKSTEPEPYEKNEFPQWAKDIRDTEIITFGSLPFVILGVTLGYSFYNVASHNYDSSYFVNPLTKEGNYKEEDQVKVLATSCCISVGLGLTNLTISLIRRGIEKKNNEQKLSQNITVTPIGNKLNLAPVPQKYLRKKNYLYGSLDNAVF